TACGRCSQGGADRLYPTGRKSLVARSNVLRLDLLTPTPVATEQRLRRKLAERPSITRCKSSEIHESTFRRNRRHRGSVSGRQELLASLPEAAIEQELRRRTTNVTLKANLECTNAYSEVTSDIGDT